MGNYASVGDSYTKGESDDLYPSKTVFNTAINARYTKTESDNLFQPKGNYATTVDFENKIKSFPTIDNVYTKTESDSKFQPKGNYSLLGDSYTKAESDGRYPALATYNTEINNLNTGLAARYTKAESDASIKNVNDNLAAGLAARYTKAESDATIKTVNDNLSAGLAARYTKTEADAALKTINDGLTARYTKTESDARYPSLSAYEAAIKAGNALVGNNIYTKSESDARYPALANYEAAIKASNDGLAARYTKAESDGRYPALATYNTEINNLNTGLAARYTKAESDGRYPALATYNTAINNLNTGLAARYTKAESDASIKTVNDNLSAGLAARYTKTEADNKVTSDIKTKSVWCADGEFCSVPTGKKGFTNGAIIIENNTIKNDKTGEAGRIHISGGERLYLLNKDGVIIGKEWGGNGNLQVQGNLFLKDGNHGMRQHNDPDGPFIHGWDGGSLGTNNNEGMKQALRWDRNQNVVLPGKNLYIGDWRIEDADELRFFNKNDLKFALRSNGQLWAQDNFYSQRWNKWL